MPARVVIALALVALASCARTAVRAPTIGPVPVLPEQLRWFSPPNNAALQGAWAVGAESARGPYALRAKLAPGGRVPPHTHPDDRTSTVLSGTLYVGFGTTFDEAKLVAVPVGGVYVAPAGVAHYVAAKDGPVLYQENGVGPTGTVPIAPTGTVPIAR